MSNQTILIENGAILTMASAQTIYDPGYLSIKEGQIMAVGAGPAPAELRSQAERMIDATQMAVLPGLINGHTHLSQTFIRGLADDRPLLRWLKEIIWPVQQQMSAEEMQLAALLGLVENLKCGVTGLVQHHKITTTRPHVLAALTAAGQVGLRLLLARGWLDLGEAGEPLAQLSEEMTWLYQTWHNQQQGRITIGFGPLAPWRCSDEAMRQMHALAQTWQLPTQIHIAETQEEVAMMQRRCGLGHIEWLHGLGCLNSSYQLVHCVWLSEAELDLIAAAGATVVYCPTSNLYLASGAAPVHQMRRRGIPIALGTDGSGSNNSQDMLELLKIGALLAKHAANDPQAVLPHDMLHMATVTGARLLGRADLGHLTPGARADVTLVNLNQPRLQPVYHPASALVYNATGPDVHTVIVEGEILLDAGRVTRVDETALLAECRRAARALWRRVGVGS